MSESGTGPGVLRFWEARGPLRFVETRKPELAHRDQVAMNELWQRAVQANPTLFDGPVVDVTGIFDDGQGQVEVSWARSTYRRNVLRQIPGARNPVLLFVAVAQPTPAGLLLGRMAAWTASGPGSWLMPGGSMEPPDPEQPLHEGLLHRHAARELREETGLNIDPVDLTRWAIARTPEGNIGIFFRSPPASEASVRATFAAHQDQQERRGEQPELSAIHFVHGPDDLDTLDGPAAAFIPALLARFPAP